jgi:drug/metabolite transporter (DMT)-like permease
VAVFAMVATAAVWGGTYVVVKQAVASMPTTDFLTWRFALAALAVVAIRPRAVFRLGWGGMAVGLALGVALASGFLLLTVGLLTTPASVSGLITGALVPLTPLTAAVLLRERPSPFCWLTVAMATAGLGLLSLQGLSLGVGEALTLLGALAFALHIVALSRWSCRYDLNGLVVVQLLTVTVMSALLAIPDGLRPPAEASVWLAVVITALLATAAAFFVQTWAQRHLSAALTGIILSLEPVFAWLVGMAVLGDRLRGRQMVGGVVLVLAMVLAAGSQKEASYA